MTTKSWFITGASSGFGREFAHAALSRGDQVAGTSRDVGRLDDLAADFGDRFLALELHVTKQAAASEAVRRAHERFGRLDVVVNNAGYGTYGVIEELSEEEARAQLDTNFFGALWVTQAALPILRAQGGGHIVQMSSLGGHFAAPSLGIYHASKWALEAMSQSLAAEVAEFGIHVTLIEPGAFATQAEASAREAAQPLAAYAAAHDALRRLREGDADGPTAAANVGDPRAGAQALLAIVDADDPPLRVLFGPNARSIVEAEYEGRLAQWRAAEPYSDLSAQRTVSPG